jgi:hypothetical protein
MEPRWEGDLRGRGVADGRRLSNEIDEFRRTITSPDWVAEEPEKHLLPHLQKACGPPDADFSLESTAVEVDGTFVVTLRPRKADNIGQIRAALFALVGQIAEMATYVRQRPQGAGSTNPPREVIFEVATGNPSGEGPFAAHGHLVRFRVQPATRT